MNNSCAIAEILVYRNETDWSPNFSSWPYSSARKNSDRSI